MIAPNGVFILSNYRFPTEPEAGGEDGTCLWSSAFPAHGNGGHMYEDWNSYSCVTIYEAAALSLGAHPKMINDFLRTDGGTLQRGIFLSLNSNLIRAVLSGSIRTIALDTPLDKSSITCHTSVYTEDVYKYFENEVLLNQECPEINNHCQSSEQEISETERVKLLKQIGVMAILLSKKSNKLQKNIDKPNVSQIAEVLQVELDAMPDANRKGLSVSNLRASISEGLKLLNK